MRHLAVTLSVIGLILAGRATAAGPPPAAGAWYMYELTDSNETVHFATFDAAVSSALNHERCRDMVGALSHHVAYKDLLFACQATRARPGPR